MTRLEEEVAAMSIDELMAELAQVRRARDELRDNQVALADQLNTVLAEEEALMSLIALKRKQGEASHGAR
jgi:hypothetical protein